MKKFIKVSAILGLVIITIAAIKYQSDKLEKKKGNKIDEDKLGNYTIGEYCK